MLRELAKYAAASAQLRERALEKRAGLIGGVVKGVSSAMGKGWAGLAAKHQELTKGMKGLTGVVARNPMKSVGVGLGVATGVPAAMGKFEQHKAGFDPAVHNQMLGQPPGPPG